MLEHDEELSDASRLRCLFWHHLPMALSDREDSVNHHASELARLTMAAAGGPEPLPEDEVAKLGMLIATERQLLIDAVSLLLQEEEPEAAAAMGVAEFDAGFRYGLEFARAIDDVKLDLERTRRTRVLKLIRSMDAD